MAERIVSPGVFTREKDLSFLPQGVGEIGGCIIGPTKTGPAFWPTVVNNFEEFKNIFGDLSTETYVPYTAKEYLRQAGRVTIVRTLGRSTVTGVPMYALTYSGSSDANNTAVDKTVATFIPTAFEGAHNTACTVETTPALTGAQPGGYVSASAFVVKLSGSTGTTSGFAELDNKDTSGTAYSASFTKTADNYIDKLFGYNPNSTKRGFLWTNFKVHQQLAPGTGKGLNGSVSGSHGTIDFPAYTHATTPWITTQKDSVNLTTQNLFRFHTLSHGTSENWRFKIGISNIQYSTLTDKGYGTFTVNVIRQDQTEINATKGDRNPYTYTQDTVVESFSGCTLDPDDANFVLRRIGDRYYKINDEGKLIGYNDYPAKSQFIRIDGTNSLKAGTIAKNQLPFGFKAVVDPIPSTIGTSPSCSFATRQGKSAVWYSDQYYGFNFNFKDSEDSNGNPAAFDNLNYLNVTPNASSHTGGNVDFNLSNMYGHADAAVQEPGAAHGFTLLTTTTGSVNQRKFAVPFQGGFDGIHPSKHKLTGANMTTTNVMGHDISTSTSEGTVAYKRAIDAISNPDEWDINLLVTPGIIYTHGSDIQNYALRKVEARADAFYLLDVAKYAASPVVSTQITDAISDAGNFDSSYAATYYPWVKLVDSDNNKHVWVPPSVVVAGVIAQTDALSHPWYAPAGLTRGGLTSVLEPATRLTHSERDDLYDSRVNPIASFPGQNVTVWGQKTLQKKASALDRINVRRLMITVKKFIASSTKFLVFEQNTAATRNRFLGIANPYLENVQSNSGLYAFKVVMDETNNTPDVIDRNELRGQIFLQPTKTAEFIVLDFNILPTGAEFPE
tara:strand:- start:17828 stop:20347 length:2520 start_codon:yes stop_codon:yes gene_type:complete